MASKAMKKKARTLHSEADPRTSSLKARSAQPLELLSAAPLRGLMREAHTFMAKIGDLLKRIKGYIFT